MKIRFAVDQAEAFRRGVDCPKSIVTVEVDPKTLSQEERDLIADRLEGIDLRRLHRSLEETVRSSSHLEALLPTFESMMEAVRANAAKLTEEVKAEAEAKTKREADFAIAKQMAENYRPKTDAKE